MNPSSGNLHPTECYLILPEIDERPPCLAHYNPYLHGLEVRAELGTDTFSGVVGFGLILTSIYWREAWKYGERAFRYCNHDVGHALAALRFSANLRGWNLVLQPEIGDRNLDRLLGFDRIEWPENEAEHADGLCWVVGEPLGSASIERVVEVLSGRDLEGKPNQLSKDHATWDIIDTVSKATRAPGTLTASRAANHTSWEAPYESPHSAPSLIRRRRSALGYDFERSKTDRPTFLGMLARTLPGRKAPFDAFPFDANVHLAIFVHQVSDLESGLYLLVRNLGQEKELNRLMSPEFSWEVVENGLPLYRLKSGDYRQEATAVSCHQDIAGAGAFSLGMLARFQPILEETPWVYPRLFWETGLIGQVLYLEAEAHDLRGTGIGCFFDDEMHRILGLEGRTYQSLYHFTVGYPLADERLQTLPAYQHLKGRD
jgi:nitroreductase